MSAVDAETEQVIVDFLRHHRPDDSILGEEDADHHGTSGVEWIIDPLDGTLNYIMGFPAHAVSIGASINGEPAVGVVRDTALHHTYTATDGGGAFVDDRRLQIRPAVALDHALVTTGFSPGRDARRLQLGVFAELVAAVGAIRRTGCPALDLCRVAAGQTHAYFEIGLGPWDYAAGRVVVERAGGNVVVRETAAGWPGPLVIAGSAELVDELLDALVAGGIQLAD